MLIEIQRYSTNYGSSDRKTSSMLVNTNSIIKASLATLDNRLVLEITMNDRDGIITCPPEEYDILKRADRLSDSSGEVWETMYRCLMSMAASIKKSNLNNAIK